MAGLAGPRPAPRFDPATGPSLPPKPRRVRAALRHLLQSNAWGAKAFMSQAPRYAGEWRDGCGSSAGAQPSRLIARRGCHGGPNRAGL